jgi:ribosomal protein S18 acetylase RimI-like enzyme
MNLLDNIVWHALDGPQRPVSAGTARARRYAPGFSPMVAFDDPRRPDFAALAPFCEPGEHFYCADWNGPAPAGWTVDVEATMFRMVWDAPAPKEDAVDARPLTAADAQQALDLALLTKPGPFGPRTIELGEYFGCFENGRLVAMAGERMHAPGLRELSGVCTHPDHQGRGLARRLMNLLLRRQLERGEQPFLHVMRANEGAHGLYQRMGFEDYCETTVRVVTRVGATGSS